jgi:hypothetical protein
MKTKFLKNEEAFKELEMCFEEMGDACLSAHVMCQDAALVLTKLKAAKKESNANKLKAKLRHFLDLLCWDCGGATGDTYEESLGLLSELLDEAIGARSQNNPSEKSP